MNESRSLKRVVIEFGSDGHFHDSSLSIADQERGVMVVRPFELLSNVNVEIVVRIVVRFAHCCANGVGSARGRSRKMRQQTLLETLKRKPPWRETVVKTKPANTHESQDFALIDYMKKLVKRSREVRGQQFLHEALKLQQPCRAPVFKSKSATVHRKYNSFHDVLEDSK